MTPDKRERHLEVNFSTKV